MATICNNCGGALLYSPTRKKMYCNKCGATFKAEEVVNDSKNLLEDIDVRKSEDIFGTSAKGSYDSNIYICNHCGGEISVNGTEASTVCIYCGNPTVVFKRVAKDMRPDGIVPFSISKSEAEMLIKTHLKNGFFIPSALKKVKTENIRGIYIPYWIVNCEFHDAVMYKGTIREGKHDRTTYAVRAGSCSFKSLPVDASLSLNDNISKRLEPFFFDDAKPFDEDYLSGFYSDASDISVSDLRATVLKRCDELFAGEAMTDIPLRDKSVVRSCPSVDIKEDLVYLMLPCWFYTFTYEGKPNTILVNGQTGKTVGTLPFNRTKVFSLTAIIFALICTLMFLPSILYGHTDSLYSYTMQLLQKYTAYLLGIGMTVLGVAWAKVKKYMKSMKDTQSGSTFVYVKKRQE